ncbi:MAG: hypothetical protein EPN62_01740 [Candidimonas sp.]|nr:MAG: hypothetical protein EPN77_08130 [Candidimonas sp.]TAM26486.1 MAG: hypothetical protein EPN62_01740 [Candidimonas sp.]
MSFMENAALMAMICHPQGVALHNIPTDIRAPLVGHEYNVAAPLVGQEYNVAAPLVGQEYNVAAPLVGHEYNVAAPQS